MPIIIRGRMSGLNNALAGLNAGLGQGIQVGQRNRQLDMQERAQAQHVEMQQRQMAMAEAQAARAAEEFDREQVEREAAKEAFSQPDPVAVQPSMNLPKMAGQMGQFGAQIMRDREIAKRMDPKLASIFLEKRKGELKERLLNQDREKLVQEIGNDLSGGAYSITQPDGTKVEDPKVTKGVQTIMDALGKGGDPVQARQQLGGLKAQLGIQAAEFSAHQAMLGKMDAEIAEVEANAATPSLASVEQTRRLHTMRQAADRFPQLLREPKFLSQWMNAVQGVEDVDGDLVPISYAQQARQLKAENAQLRNDLVRSQQVTENKQAEYLDARTMDVMRGDKPKPFDKSVSDKNMAELRKAGAEAVRAKRGPDDKGPITEADIQREVRLIQGETDPVAEARETRVGGAAAKAKELNANPAWSALSEDEKVERFKMWLQTGEDPIPAAKKVDAPKRRVPPKVPPPMQDVFPEKVERTDPMWSRDG